MIEGVHNFNFLGININENLSWVPHIDKISVKISRCIGIISKLKHILPVNTLKIIYHSLLISHLTYGILVWGTKCYGLGKLQKKAIRIITNSKVNAHTSPLFKYLGCVTFEDLYTLNILKFYFNYCHSLVPSYFIKLNFCENSDIHSHDTRSKYWLSIIRTRTKMAVKCLRYITPKIINETCPNILNKIYTHSYVGYITYIKYTFVDSYQIECNLLNCYVCER